MLDETRAHLLQDIYYISSQNPMILGMLHEEVVTISHILLNIQARKTKYIKDFTTEAWESASNFISIYLKRPGWICESFRNRIYLEIKYELYNPKKKKYDQIKQTELDESICKDLPQEKEDSIWVLEDLKFSFPEKYSKILFDCYKARSYKSFILTISKYLTKRQIYDHALRLNVLYKNTRRVK